MDLRSGQWCRPILNALENEEYRQLAWNQLPRIIDQFEPLGPLAQWLAVECDLDMAQRPLLFPTSDDQQAGLVGGGAVDAGQVAIVLGNSAVVNSSSSQLPLSGTLDAMKLNWGPYLWMRCYNNGAQFLDRVLDRGPIGSGWASSGVSPGVDGRRCKLFTSPEPSLESPPRLQWHPAAPAPGKKFRPSLGRRWRT